MEKKVCPECKGNIFHEDLILEETCCRQCGLVLVAPNVHGLVFPGYLVVPRKRKWIVKIRIPNQLLYRIGYNLE